VSTLVSTTRAILSEFQEGRTITPMPRPADRAVSKSCVNVLKKVKVDGLWKFCPIVKEPNGRLKDRVRVNRQTEIHHEGVYYIEWREGGTGGAKRFQGGTKCWRAHA